MIAKHISCKAINDNYRRLANYIANTNDKGEKCLHTWCVSCEGSDNDYERAINEVADIQGLNKRTQKEKSYHLIVSFRTEDEGKINEIDYKYIEEEFAKALGFQNHQRHCAVHKNTDNLHMHIAYNMINLETYRRHEPYKDYYALERVCRSIEQKYNLSVDNGITHDESYKLSNNSVSKEIKTGEESFERYLLKKHDTIMQELENAHSWEKVHNIFTSYGLELTQRGNGLSIKNKRGNQRLKASKFDKELSYKKMCGKFGEFQKMKYYANEKESFKRTPLQNSPYKKELWLEYIKETKQREIILIKEKWRKEKIRITGLPISKEREWELLKQAKNKEKLEINELKQSVVINTGNWIDFLKIKANEGDDKALDVLRSIPENKIHKEYEIHAKGKYKQSLIEEKEMLKYKEKILSTNINQTAKKTLIAVEQFKRATSNIKESFSYKITSKGAIIFELASGGKIIDTGMNVLCTQGLENIAERYKNIKMGKSISREVFIVHNGLSR